MMSAMFDGGDGDSRFHISLKAVKEYVESRKKTAQVEFNNGSITVTSDQLCIDILLERNVIDNAQHWAALFMIRLHDVAFSNVGYARMREIITEFMSTDDYVSDVHPMTLYVRIMRALPKWQSSMVERVCWQPVHAGDYQWMYHYRHRVQEAFDAVQKLIELHTKPPAEPHPIHDDMSR